MHLDRQWQPLQTPKTIRWIIAVTIATTLLLALVDSSLAALMGLIERPFEGSQWLFGLSWYGWDQKWLWQPVTYLFFYGTAAGALSWGLLIQMVLQMYLLWIFGAELCESIAESTLLYFYLIVGAISGTLTLWLFPTPFSFFPLTGPEASLLALFTLWTMKGPDRELLLFFFLAVQARWIFGAIIGALLLISATQGLYWQLVYYSTAIVLAYLGAILAFNLTNPCPQLACIDRLLLKGKRSAIRLSSRWRSTSSKSPTEEKIIDFRTGDPIYRNDDQFVDAMLAKIARSGERALSWREKKRLDLIALHKRESKEKAVREEDKLP